MRERKTIKSLEIHDHRTCYTQKNSIFTTHSMTSRFDRFFNPKDGTYANVPIIKVNPEKYRGKRYFGTRVLIGNWYEDREKFNESPHRSKSFYKIAYPAHVGSVPDTVLRRQFLKSGDERPARLILDHHDIDNQKQLISSYDEQYHRRGAYGENQDTTERRWLIQDDVWLPERSDHPLESKPTSWGLIDRKRSQSQCLQRQRITPEMSEYSDRYGSRRQELFSSRKNLAIPRIESLNRDKNERPPSNCNRRLLASSDSTETDFMDSLRRSDNAPRAYFYVGAIPNQVNTTTTHRRLPRVTQSVVPMRAVTPLIEHNHSHEQMV